MIIPKTLNKLYMLTPGNILYLITDVGYKTIEPRKATIRKIICANKLEPQDFIMVLEIDNSYMRLVYITQSIIDNIKNNSIVYGYTDLYFLTTDPYQLRQKYKNIITLICHSNKLEKAIHNNYNDRQEQLIKMYGQYTQNNIKDTIKRSINNIKIYCKENHAE
jgi:hypothetical protein